MQKVFVPNVPVVPIVQDVIYGVGPEVPNVPVVPSLAAVPGSMFQFQGKPISRCENF
jgi:hypothetical protein